MKIIKALKKGLVEEMITRTEVIEESGADDDLILTTSEAKKKTTTLYMLGNYQIDVDRYNCKLSSKKTVKDTFFSKRSS